MNQWVTHQRGDSNLAFRDHWRVSLATLHLMESKVAKEARLALLADARRLTPEQRLNAFLAHCQLMMELHATGQKIRSSRKKLRT
jgi:hypothetical protein